MITKAETAKCLHAARRRRANVVPQRGGGDVATANAKRRHGAPLRAAYSLRRHGERTCYMPTDNTIRARGTLLALRHGAVSTRSNEPRRRPPADTSQPLLRGMLAMAMKGAAIYGISVITYAKRQAALQIGYIPKNERAEAAAEQPAAHATMSRYEERWRHIDEAPREVTACCNTGSGTWYGSRQRRRACNKPYAGAAASRQSRHTPGRTHPARHNVTARAYGHATASAPIPPRAGR